MSEQSAKPYLIRAIHEWCSAEGFTPYLVVRVDERTVVPRNYVREGEITLNLSLSATHKLTIDNEWICFNARFNGVSQEIFVPIYAVANIFARETGYGMGFPVSAPPQEAPSMPAPTTTEPPNKPKVVARVASTGVEKTPDLSKTDNTEPVPEATTAPKRGHLQVVK